MNLSLPQQFEAEAIKRSIDDTDDLDQLKSLARELADPVSYTHLTLPTTLVV